MSNTLQPYFGSLQLGASCNQPPTYCGVCQRPAQACLCPPVPVQPAPVPVQPELCWAAAVPPAYANLYLDVNYDGVARVEQVILRSAPNDHTFNLTTDVLPFGWVFDAINGVLYYPQGYMPNGKFAVWTAPTAMDACGAYVWTATEICLKLESGNCGDLRALSVQAQNQYFCLSATYTTTITQALTSLRAAFGQGVQLSHDGGTTENSLFQLAANSQPTAWAGDANIPASTWNLGRCDAPGYSITAAQMCNGLQNITDAAALPAAGSVVMTTPTGCIKVPFNVLQNVVPIFKCDGTAYNELTDRLVSCAEFSPLTAAYLAGLTAGGALTPSVELVGSDSFTYNLPLSATAQIITCDGTPLDPNIDRIVACDQIGTALLTLPIAPLDETESLYIFQGDGAGGFELAQVPAHTAQCAYTAASGASRLSPTGWEKSESKLNSITLSTGTHTLNPALHEIVYLDATAGNITFNLIAPGNCQRNHFWLKRIDTNAANTVTVQFAPGIDSVASITLLPLDVFTPTQGEAVHIHYNGVAYFVI